MSRNLNQNSKTTKLEKAIVRLYTSELGGIYRKAYMDVRAEVTRLLTSDPASLTRAQRAQLLRSSNLLIEINRVIETPIMETERFLKELSQATLQGSYLKAGWAVEQAAGVSLQWGLLNDNAVRAAVGLTDEFQALAGVMGKAEIARHRKVVTKAFKNYATDTKKWIGREVAGSIIKGESIPKLTKRIKTGLDKSYRSAETIARTETLRSLSLGSQIAYDESEDEGIRVKQIWIATLDIWTRPDHAEMDGRERDEETGLFPAPWGASPGPHRNGIAKQDINCRCDVRPEIEGYSPEKRRIRDEGLVPNKTFTKWASDNGIVSNQYGQKYKFLVPVEL